MTGGNYECGGRRHSSSRPSRMFLIQSMAPEHRLAIPCIFVQSPKLYIVYGTTYIMLYTMRKRAEEVWVHLSRPYLSQWSVSGELRKQQKSLAGLAEVKFLHLYRLKEGGLHVCL